MIVDSSLLGFFMEDVVEDVVVRGARGGGGLNLYMRRHKTNLTLLSELLWLGWGYKLACALYLDEELNFLLQLWYFSLSLSLLMTEKYVL